MRAFLGKLFRFIAAGFVLFVCISLFFEERVRKNDNFFNHIADYQHPANQPEVLFLGDSVVAFDIHRSQMPGRFYNFGSPGENLRQVYLRFRHAVRTKPSLRYLVLQIDDHVLSSYRAEHEGYTDHLYFGKYQDILQVYPSSRASYLHQLLAFYFPLLESRQRWTLKVVLLRDLAAWLTGEGLGRGRYLDTCMDYRRREERPWTLVSAVERDRHARETVRIQLNRNLLEPDLVLALERVLDLARRHHIEVIGVRFPLSREYRTQAQPIDTSAVRRHFEGVGLATILDYRDLFDDRQELFNDSNHLQPAGARAFTRHLLADLAPLVGPVDHNEQVCLTYANRPDANFFWPYRQPF